MIKIILLALVTVCPCRGSIVTNDLNGLWQANTCIGSGLAEVWYFSPDGTFLFRASSMDGAARLREFCGTWVVLDDTLRLTVTAEIIEEGGHLEPGDGTTSIGSDSILVDSEEVERTLDPPEIRNLIIESLGLDTMESNPELPADLMRMDLDGTTYWRFTSDPESAMELLGI